MTARRHRVKEAPLIHDPDPVVAAKAVAMEFAWCVRASNWPRARKLTRDMNGDQLLMLAAVLAEAYPPGSMRLLQVTQARDAETGRSEAQPAAVPRSRPVAHDRMPESAQTIVGPRDAKGAEDAA